MDDFEPGRIGGIIVQRRDLCSIEDLCRKPAMSCAVLRCRLVVLFLLF